MRIALLWRAFIVLLGKRHCVHCRITYVSLGYDGCCVSIHVTLVWQQNRTEPQELLSQWKLGALILILDKNTLIDTSDPNQAFSSVQGI